MKNKLFSNYIYCLLLLVSLSSCGSRNDTFRKFGADVLEALKQKKQKECLSQNSNKIKAFKNKTLNIFAAARVNNFWEFTYNRDNTDSETEDTIRVTQVYIKEITGQDIATEITFLVINEDGTDGENETNDQKEFLYSVQNQLDHIQLIAIEACSDAQDLNISESRIEFNSVKTNKSVKYFVDDSAPAFLSRFYSYVSQIRSNDTDDQLGSITANIKNTPKLETNRVLPAISSDSISCPTSPIIINFDSFSTDGSEENTVILFPQDSNQTLESTFGFQDDNGIAGC